MPRQTQLPVTNFVTLNRLRSVCNLTSGPVTACARSPHPYRPTASASPATLSAHLPRVTPRRHACKMRRKRGRPPWKGACTMRAGHFPLPFLPAPPRDPQRGERGAILLLVLLHFWSCVTQRNRFARDRIKKIFISEYNQFRMPSGFLRSWTSLQTSSYHYFLLLLNLGPKFNRKLRNLGRCL